MLSCIRKAGVTEMANWMNVLFLLLAACQLALCVPEVEMAASYNEALAPSLLGAANPCWEQATNATADDMLELAGMRIVSAIPQVGNVTSDDAAPKLLWSWFASFPQSATFASPSSNGCPGTALELYAPSGPYLGNAKLSYEYGNKSAEVALGPSGPDPVPLGLNESSLRDGDFASLYANLTLEISGNISVRYSYSQTDYSQECHGPGGENHCTCVPHTSFGSKEYSRNASDSRLLLVETGPVEAEWLNPPLGKRLVWNETAGLLLFARRMPANISVSAGGKQIGWSSQFAFSTATGDCGEMAVSAAPLVRQAGVGTRLGNGTLFPPQLVERNASYVPAYVEFNWSETPGKKEVNVSIEDWFSGLMNFTSDFSVHEPAPFSSGGSGGGMEMREGTDSLSPAAYPAEVKTAALPDYSPLALLVTVPLALGSYSLLSWLRGGNME